MAEPFPFSVGDRVRMWPKRKTSNWGKLGTVDELPYGWPDGVGVMPDEPRYLGSEALTAYLSWWELEPLEEGEG